MHGIHSGALLRPGRPVRNGATAEIQQLKAATSLGLPTRTMGSGDAEEEQRTLCAFWSNLCMPCWRWKTSQVNSIARKSSNHLLTLVSGLLGPPAHPGSSPLSRFPESNASRHVTPFCKPQTLVGSGARTGRPLNFACRIFPPNISPNPQNLYLQNRICSSPWYFAVIYRRRACALLHIEFCWSFESILMHIGRPVDHYLSRDKALLPII